MSDHARIDTAEAPSHQGNLAPCTIIEQRDLIKQRVFNRADRPPVHTETPVKCVIAQPYEYLTQSQSGVLAAQKSGNHYDRVLITPRCKPQS